MGKQPGLQGNKLSFFSILHMSSFEHFFQGSLYQFERIWYSSSQRTLVLLTAQGNRPSSLPFYKFHRTSIFAMFTNHPVLFIYIQQQSLGLLEESYLLVRSGFFYQTAGSTVTFVKVRPRLPHGTRWTGIFLLQKVFLRTATAPLLCLAWINTSNTGQALDSGYRYGTREGQGNLSWKAKYFWKILQHTSTYCTTMHSRVG